MNRHCLKYIKRLSGATLTELMIATAVFSFVSIGLIAIIQFGTKSWRQIESRFEVEKGIRRAVMDLNYNLRNTDIKTVSAGIAQSPENAFPEWLAFQSSAEIDHAGNILDDNLNYDFVKNKIVYNFFIIYYTIPRKEGSLFSCSECKAIGNSDPVLCPHKLFVKRFLFRGTPPDDVLAGSIPEKIKLLDSVQIIPFLRQPRIDAGDRILSKSIMDFRLSYDDSLSSPKRRYVNENININLNSVMYTIRAFKSFEASQANVRVSLNPANSSFANRKFSDKYTVQIDQGIVPLNSKK